MPVLDGYNATRAIRKDEDRRVREVLIIAMTASAIRGDREKCLEAGMNDYLAKPVRQTALKEMLDEYLNNTRSAQYAASPADNGIETPGDKANKETAKVPVKAHTPLLEKPEGEGGLTAPVERRMSETPIATLQKNGQKPDATPVTPPTGKTNSAESGEQNQPAKPKKKRIALKGSARNKPPEESKSNGEVKPPSLNPDQTKRDASSQSPPSGVKEQVLLGKISTEVVSPPTNGPTKDDIETKLAETASEQRRNDSVNHTESNQTPPITISPPEDKKQVNRS